VDFERGVNAAVNRLRDVLNDSADEPRFIETLPRRGYRFIGTINPPTNPRLPGTRDVTSDSRLATEGDAPRQRQTWNGLNWWKVLLLGGVVATVLLLYRRNAPPSPAPELSPVPFTDYPGLEYCPAFSPDGSRVSFAWTGPDDGSDYLLS
jgi:hypothetical protein